MKKTILWLTLVVLVGVLIGGLSLKWHRHVYASQTLNTRPFVMERIDFTVKNGQEVPTAKTIIVQRRDGGTAQIETFLDSGKQFRRVDLPNGYVAMISDALHIKSSGVVPEKMLASSKQRMTPPPINCLSANEIVDGEEQLFGQKVLRVVRESPDGLQRIIGWRLPDFHCTSVQLFSQARPDLASAWQTKGGARLTAFVEQNPDSRIFSDDSTYREIKPSDLKREVMKNSGVTPQQCAQCFADDPDADANYKQRQAPTYAPNTLK